MLTGTLVPREEVLVSPQLDGLAITKLLVDEGDTVQAGQILAELSHDVLDTSLAQNAAQLARSDASIAQAQNAIQEADATRVQADAAFGRSRALLSTGSASQETFDARQQGAQVSAARLNNAQNALHLAVADRALVVAQRQELEVRLARSSIRAPVAGLISRRVARLGAVVSMNGDPLFRIIEDGAIELEADVPESRLGRLHPGQPATIGDAPGHVRLVSPEVNRATRLGRVRIAFDKPAPGVIGGFARASVDVATAQGVRVPLSAILFEPGGPVVQVVKQGLVETRPVTMALSSGGVALITAGLAAGEAVVSVSATFVRGGDQVTAVTGG